LLHALGDAIDRRQREVLENIGGVVIRTGGPSRS
jgi:hypothetical protein